MRHHITEENPFGTLTSGVIDCSFLYSYIKAYKISVTEIAVLKIRAKNLHYIKEWHPRYRAADVEKPSIVAKQEGFYRLIDGRHRMRKAIAESRLRIPCYVLTPKEVLKFYRS